MEFDHAVPLNNLFSICWLHGVKIELVSRDGQIFAGVVYFDNFPGKHNISKITVFNCYLAINCPNPTPSLF